MPALLHIDTSARTRSFSRELSRTFTESWRTVLPQTGYTYRDLAAEPVPPITEAWTELCDNVLARGDARLDRLHEAAVTAGQQAAWEITRPLLRELEQADVVLIGTPMYNYSVPAALKLWIDQVAFPRMSLAGRTFVVAGARGGSYRPGAPKAPFDHHESYLRDFFQGHFAVEDVVFLHAEFTNATVDPALADLRSRHDESHAAALAEAADLGRRLAIARSAA
ncbi:FMN-dependent NADH-azoreductase [Streptomyces sp. NPDC018031]|uniref:FMN-dependent NADH-azoreductase n=1 Tax=Streptomyces sp. NPDC018031 TaxID=3365033 RepID=UPI00378AF70C